MSESPESLALRVLGALMDQNDRCSAVDEAKFSAMETVTLLLHATAGVRDDHCSESLELLHQALGAARATVVATGYAFTTSTDVARRNSQEGFSGATSHRL